MILDRATIDVIDAIDSASRALSDREHWSPAERRMLKQAIKLMLQATGDMDHIEINPPVADLETL